MEEEVEKKEQSKKLNTVVIIMVIVSIFIIFFGYILQVKEQKLIKNILVNTAVIKWNHIGLITMGTYVILVRKNTIKIIKIKIKMVMFISSIIMTNIRGDYIVAV